jgi:hypothetical protein
MKVPVIKDSTQLPRRKMCATDLIRSCLPRFGEIDGMPHGAGPHATIQGTVKVGSAVENSAHTLHLAQKKRPVN